MAQLVKYLPYKPKHLSSNPSTYANKTEHRGGNPRPWGKLANQKLTGPLAYLKEFWDSITHYLKPTHENFQAFQEKRDTQDLSLHCSLPQLGVYPSLCGETAPSERDCFLFLIYVRVFQSQPNACHKEDYESTTEHEEVASRNYKHVNLTWKMS